MNDNKFKQACNMLSLFIFLSLFVYLLSPLAFAETVSEEQLTQMRSLLPTIEQCNDPKEPLKCEIWNKEVENCTEFLTARYDIETLAFLGFLDDHFKNKSSNSSLMNTAIARYYQYKKTLEGIFLELTPNAPNILDNSEYLNQMKTYGTEFEAFQKCSEITDAYIELTKEQMIQHIKATGAQKKTTILVEKYSSINDQLAKLNFNLARTFALFMTFKNKLPGFLTKCVKS